MNSEVPWNGSQVNLDPKLSCISTVASYLYLVPRRIEGVCGVDRETNEGLRLTLEQDRDSKEKTGQMIICPDPAVWLAIVAQEWQSKRISEGVVERVWVMRLEWCQTKWLEDSMVNVHWTWQAVAAMGTGNSFWLFLIPWNGRGSSTIGEKRVTIILPCPLDSIKLVNHFVLRKYFRLYTYVSNHVRGPQLYGWIACSCEWCGPTFSTTRCYCFPWSINYGTEWLQIRYIEVSQKCFRVKKTPTWCYSFIHAQLRMGEELVKWKCDSDTLTLFIVLLCIKHW